MCTLIKNLAIAGALSVSSIASAAISSWTDDFEGYTQTDCTALQADYLVFGTVTNGATGDYGYGAVAPNRADAACGGPQFSSIASGEGDVPQGAQQLSVYSDYENGDHGTPGAVIVSAFYKEYTIAASNVGETWTFAYDAKLGDLGGATTATAYMVVLNPATSFSVTAIDSVDMTATPGTWNGYTVSLTIDPSWVGQVFQIGMDNTASGFEPSGIFYDNLNLSSAGGGGITAWTDDFEGYTQTDCTALQADYLVFGTVTNGATGDYGYGAVAPNRADAACGGPQFSSIASGEGDVPQGAQQLSVYSDYENGDHGTPGAVIVSAFYKEYTIAASNVGETWTFAYDAKLGDLGGATTATAYMVVLNPATSFSVTAIDSVDMTATPGTWNGYTVSLTIDPSWVGQVFQIGMDNTASGFEPSGIFYDNLSLVQGGIDTDGDGVDDSTDNCTNFANAAQVDSDGDGHGNACDGDFQNNCLTNIFDLFAFKAAFGSSDPADAQYDMNSTGGPTSVNIFDLFRFKAVFGTPPGPSAPGALCP